MLGGVTSCRTFDKLREDLRDGNQWLFSGTDLIVVDEVHRLGAPTWSQAYRDLLLKVVPNSNILGLTATEKRYLDNERNMPLELFGPNGIVFHKKLSDAWDEHIYPAPDYRIGCINILENVATLKKQINDANFYDSASREKIMRDFKKIEDNYSRTEGVGDIFKECVPADTKKIIVFSNRIGTIPEVENFLKKGFNYAGFTNIKFYEVHSKNKFHKEALKKFNIDNFQGLKIAVSVDMLNEGLHIDDCTAVILLRETLSCNIFLQQIGRVMSLSNKKKPLIIDLVRNIQISSFGQELFNNPFGSIINKTLNQMVSSGVSSIQSNDLYKIQISGKEIVDLVSLERALEAATSYDPRLISSWVSQAKKGDFSFIQNEPLW